MFITTSRFLRALPALLLAAAQAAGLLAPVGTEPAEAAFPGDNGKIAFHSSRTSGPGVNNPTGDNEFFVMKPDGTGLEQLTVNTTQDFDPAWSADGGWIAYTSDQDGNAEIYMRNYDDSGAIVLIEERRLTNNAAFDGMPTFSDDGSKIAFVSNRDGNSEIYVMSTTDSNDDGNGDDLIRLTNNANAVYDVQPAWSPDGTKIAFESNRGGDDDEIFVMKAKPEGRKNRPKNLTKNNESELNPDWRPVA